LSPIRVFAAFRQRWVNQLGADVIACLARRQAHDQRAAPVIDYNMQF
jgi:hypothetical protein